MSILEKSGTALCHEDIEKQVSEKMDRVTIYRILQGFCDNGQVHKIINENGKTYYALCHDCTAENHHDNHPHFQCIVCRTIRCIEVPIVEQPLPKGYDVLSSTAFISGYCQKCSKLLKTVCLFLSLLVGPIASFAQTQVTVLDKETNSPVASALVYYPDMKTGNTTDTLGQFSVKFSIPQLLVQVSAPGYQTCLTPVSLQKDRQIIYLEPSVHELQEIVVSDYNSRLQGENVMNVEKLSLRNRTIQGITLADKLTSVAGVENLSTGAGIGKPVIRGLSGNRIAVFSQGLRLENQQWGDEHGLGLDENGYEQVEIIKGPASLLYGSDALGGVLYFVDERYAQSDNTEAAINSEFSGNTSGFGNNGSLKWSKNRLHWNLFGGYTTHADYMDGKNNSVKNSRFNTGNFKTAFGYAGNKFVSSLKYGFLKERYGLTEMEESDEQKTSASGRKPVQPYQDLSTHLISSENTFFFDNGSKLKIDAGYVFNNRKEFEDEHDAETQPVASPHEHEEAALNMNLHTFSYNAKWHSSEWNERWSLIAGSQGMIQSNANRGEEILVPDANTFDFGVFGLTNFHYSQKAYWQLGLRFDTRSITSEALEKQYYSFNFSTGIYQPLTKDLSFRANLSSGFRAPSMYELLSDGIHHGTNRYEIGNRGLKTENSYQVDVSFNYNVKHVEIFVNPYFNYIRNYIRLEPASDRIDNVPVFNYTQNNAYLYGGEAGFHFHPHPLDWLHVESSYSSAWGQDDGHHYLALRPSQKINATVSANFSFNEKKRSAASLRHFSVYLQNRYSFVQNKVAGNETPTPDYNLLHVGLVFEWGVKSQTIRLNTSINNVLNESYYDHLSRYKTAGIYNRGRNFTVKLSVPLRFK